MKKIILSAIIISGLAVACTPKASPAKTAELIPMAGEVKTSSDLVAAGQKIFTTNCTKCHGAKTEYVTGHTYEEARPVLASMVQKSKLTDKEIQAVSAYVNSVAKK